MTPSRLFVLLPCESLEGLELDRSESDAEQLLSAWSALWHPELLAAARSVPQWAAAATPPEPADFLAIVTEGCQPRLPPDWTAEAEAAGARIFVGLKNRAEMVAAALGVVRSHPCPLPEGEGTVLAADFLALGYCQMLLEVIASRARYASNPDEAALRAAVLAAAEAAVRGDAASARRELQAAFDRLHEAREYHSAVEPRLIDLTLVAESTLGQPLSNELAAGGPCSLLVSGQVVESMACREPATLAALKSALAAVTTSLVGGEFAEGPLPLLGPEAILLGLRRGLERYQRHLGCRPTVFGRRRFGLSPALPQILRRLGFDAAFHCTLDDGQFPVGSQSRIQWAGIDGSTIDALSCVPLDAGRAASFLRVAERLADDSQLDQAATLVFAHWPGRTSDWYADLRRIASYSSVLGRFLTIGGYFGRTNWDSPHTTERPDAYRSPYLRQDAARAGRDPISRWVRYASRRAMLEAGSGLHMLAAACGAPEDRRLCSGITSAQGNRTAPEIDESLALAVEDSLELPPRADEARAALDARLTESVEQALAAFARSLTGAQTAGELGLLAVNPWSFSRRAVACGDCRSPAGGCGFQPQGRTSQSEAGCRDRAGSGGAEAIGSHVVAEVPAMGFTWVPDAAAPAPASESPGGWFAARNPKGPPPLAEECRLRNEFCEIRFDPQTGAIASVRDYQNRDPRASQQVAMRLAGSGDPDSESRYSIMAADEIRVTSSGPLLGEMTVRGRLLDRQGVRVAGFRQTTRLWRGSRIVELAVDLDIDRLPEADPWDSYYAVRLAWKDPAAAIYRGINMAVTATELRRIESPQFIDIRGAGQRTTLLCGGLPYHRRLGDRKLDTLLVVRGETARSFRLGLGIDVAHPMAAAIEFLSPPFIVPQQPRPPITSGWLFHLDRRNVLATHWEPLYGAETPADSVAGGTGISVSPEQPGLVGFRVRLLELDGRSVRLGLRCFRAPASARRIDGDAEVAETFAVEGDRVEILLDAHQWIEAEIRFARP